MDNPATAPATTLEDALELAAHHPAIAGVLLESDDRSVLIAAWAALHEQDPRKSLIVAELVQRNDTHPLSTINYVSRRLASGPHESLEEFIAEIAHNCGPLSALNTEDAKIAARYFNYREYWAVELCKEWDVYKIDGHFFALSRAESLFADEDND